MFYRGYGFEIFANTSVDSPEVIGQAPEVIPHGNIPHENIGQGAGKGRGSSDERSIKWHPLHLHKKGQNINHKQKSFG